MIPWLLLPALGLVCLAPMRASAETEIVDVVPLGKGQPAPFEGVLYSTEAARIEEGIVVSAKGEATIWREDASSLRAQLTTVVADFKAYAASRDKRDAEMAIYYKKEIAKAAGKGFLTGAILGAVVVFVVN